MGCALQPVSFWISQARKNIFITDCLKACLDTHYPKATAVSGSYEISLCPNFLQN